MVGKVIGSRGETINLLQAKSGARIQIDQKVPEGMPCKVEISGDAATTEAAIRLVTDLINGGNLVGAPEGGMGGGGGMGGRMGMGGGGGMGGMGGMGGRGGMGGYQQPAAYGGYPQQQSYGGYPQQAAYGGYQQPYGGGGYPQQQQQSYGGYGGGGAAAYGAPAAVPKASNWSQHDDGSGNKYWYNSVTGQSQWEKPADA
jgi:far upstream element-binding protein